MTNTIKFKKTGTQDVTIVTSDFMADYEVLPLDVGTLYGVCDKGEFSFENVAIRRIQTEHSGERFNLTDVRSGRAWNAFDVHSVAKAKSEFLDRLNRCESLEYLKEVVAKQPTVEESLLDQKKQRSRKQLWMELSKKVRGLYLDPMFLMMGKCSIDVIKLDAYVRPGENQSLAERCEELYGKEIADSIKSLI